MAVKCERSFAPLLPQNAKRVKSGKVERKQSDNCICLFKNHRLSDTITLLSKLTSTVPNSIRSSLAAHRHIKQIGDIEHVILFGARFGMVCLLPFLASLVNIPMIGTCSYFLPFQFLNVIFRMESIASVKNCAINEKMLIFDIQQLRIEIQSKSIGTKQTTVNLLKNISYFHSHCAYYKNFLMRSMNKPVLNSIFLNLYQSQIII